MRPRMDNNKEGIESVNDLMDSYLINYEDRDGVVEFGLGPIGEA